MKKLYISLKYINDLLQENDKFVVDLSLNSENIYDETNQDLKIVEIREKIILEDTSKLMKRLITH